MEGYKQEKGDLAVFLEQQFRKYAVATNQVTWNLPSVQTSWSHSTDREGTQILAYSADFEGIYATLTNLAGMPVSSSQSGKTNGFFSVKKNGIALTYNVTGTNLHLIFLKPKQ